MRTAQRSGAARAHDACAVVFTSDRLVRCSPLPRAPRVPLLPEGPRLKLRLTVSAIVLSELCRLHACTHASGAQRGQGAAVQWMPG